MNPNLASIVANASSNRNRSVIGDRAVKLPMNEMSGWYIASESSFYRVLTEHNENHRRGSRHSGRVGPPRRHEATKPNQVWCWDVTYLKTIVRGRFFYLYFMLDIYGRKIVGAEVFDAENAVNSEIVLRKALLRQGCVNTPPGGAF
jgi:putative transposase